MAAAVERIRAAIAAGERICVHGDYDVDGICATALAVLMLRELGADVEWHLPSRFEEGYGVSDARSRGWRTRAAASCSPSTAGSPPSRRSRRRKARGLDVIVTDHHRPGETLPDCPVVATRPSDYPVPGALRHRRRLQARPGARRRTWLARHLDLVALATVADVVPLARREPRARVAGLRALARTQQPGLRALMRVARVDPAAVDAGAVGFRLAPRINAAGRLGRPDAALELLLTTDDGRGDSGSPTSSRR